MSLNVRDFAATGNGVDDDLAAFVAAGQALASQGGGKLVVPFGTYRLGRASASAPFCLDWPADNCHIEMEHGARLLMAPGMPAAQIALVRMNMRRNVLWTGGVIDGNWGADVTNVNLTLRTDAQDGVNHATQIDPKSHTWALRGCEGFKALGVRFTQAYGDCVWIGHGAVGAGEVAPPSIDIVLDGCLGNVAARNGVSLAGPTMNVRVIDSEFVGIWACPFDLEHAGAVDAQFIGSKGRLWWNAGSLERDAMRMGMTIDGDGGNYSRGVVVDRCDIEGTILVQRVLGLRMSRTRAECPWGSTTPSWAPLLVRFDCDDVVVSESDFVTSCAGPNALQTAQNPGRAAVLVDHYAQAARPKNVTLDRVRAFATAPGVHGFALCGTDGGIVSLSSCDADLTRIDGTGNGGRGVDVFSEKPGMRVRARGGGVRNATGPAYRVRFTNNPINAMRHLDVDDVSAWDDQSIATCTAVLGIDAQRHIERVDVGRVTRGSSVLDDFVGWP